MISPSLPIPDEVWKDIPGIDGYQASDLGRIRSVRHLVLCANGQRQFHGGHDLRLYPDSKGYLYVKIRQHGKRRNRFVHQLVLSAFRGQMPDGMEGCHNDGCRSNNRLDNLRWDTRSGNHRDKRLHGTFAVKKKNSKYGADLVGNRFGKLTVVALDFVDQYSRWKCVCDCGKTKVVSRKALVTGGAISCGCAQLEHAKQLWRTRRGTRFLTLGEKTLSLSEWARETGIKSATISRRIESGWSIEKAMSTPLLRTRRGNNESYRTSSI